MNIKKMWILEFTNSLNWFMVWGGRLDRGVVFEVDTLSYQIVYICRSALQS